MKGNQTMKNRNNRITTILLAVGFLALACFALPQRTQAVSPAPDGGYTGGNTAEGTNALLSLTTGRYNTAVGLFSLLSLTAGSFNTATGAGTLLVNSASENTATGAGALLSNTTGGGNTANGAFALFSNTIGQNNTANGVSALQSNTEGSDNTAIGRQALFSNTTGGSNTAIGDSALFNNTTGGVNTAVGLQALENNTTGNRNTATGLSALSGNAAGNDNTATGHEALQFNLSSGNTAMGSGALSENATGSNNTAIGLNAGDDLTGDNNIDIGSGVQGVAAESNTIRIGNTDITDTFIRGISGATASGGAAVFVNGSGKLGTLTSSAQFKNEIKPMGTASEVILALRPVSFRYKKEIDPQSIPQFGLVAEDVEKVSPDLVIRDREGKPQTVRYEQINAMLLNEFLKEHSKVGELEAMLDAVNKRLNEQEARIQKGSAKLEVSKPATNMALNSQ
jgi:trimeric autotransporter adhesin